MKTCSKCRVAKPESDFYRKSGAVDRLDTYCKPCRCQDSKAREKTRAMPWSTEQAIKMMAAQGIPATVGYILGRPGRDVVAYGYITVEAKSAQAHGKNGFAFGMTKAQLESHCDYYVLICKGVDRVYVVPKDSEVLSFDGTVLYINITDSRLQPFESAWSLIKEHALRDIRESKPIPAVSVFSGGRYAQVSCS